MADNDERPRRLKSRSIQLGDQQWDWLDARAERTFSRSASVELRQLVSAAMEEEESRLSAAAA